MSFLEIKNVCIAGMATAVPKKTILNEEEWMAKHGADKPFADFKATVGVSERRFSNRLTMADLCCKSAEQLLDDLKWEKDSVEAILCVTITPDYTLPVNSCIIQDRLGLSKECYAQDICLGCSGWIYGLSVISTLLREGNIKRALLMSGDSKQHWGSGDEDYHFGSAATVTALEYTPGAEGFKFSFGTDGNGYETIIMPKSGMRNMKYDEETIKKFEDPLYQSSLEAEMKETDVVKFSLTRVPESINSLSDHFGIDYKKCDYIVLHQATKCVNEKITEMLGIESGKAISSLEKFGNTLSASIPLTITTQLRGKIENQKTKFVCCGFGVGLSWGSVAFTTEKIVVSDLVEVEENAFENLTWV